jgi:micrococcal nuclease
LYEYRARIVDVYDGDTFTFEVDLGFSITVKEKLRLFGINTPEVRGSDKIYGKEVRDYVRDLILNKEVTIRVYKKGKFGRYVAEVWYMPDDLELGGLPSDGKILDSRGYNLTEHLLATGKGKEFMKDEKHKV